MLPGTDGIALCRIFRARSEAAIIMLTARGEVADRVTGFNNGADDYVPKPFTFVELMARIRAMLRQRARA